MSEALKRFGRVLRRWFHPVGTAQGGLGWLQMAIALTVLLFGATAVAAATTVVSDALPRGFALAVVLLFGIISLGLFASYRQQEEIDSKPDEIDEAMKSLKTRTFEVNAYEWNQADVFLWAGEEWVLKNLSEGELAFILAKKMGMRSFDSVRIEPVLKEWHLAGLVSWELVTPVPADQFAGYPIGATPYNLYQLTPVGKRVLARLRDEDSIGIVNSPVETSVAKAPAGEKRS